jgi:hypothetical protein
MRFSALFLASAVVSIPIACGSSGSSDANPAGSDAGDDGTSGGEGGGPGDDAGADAIVDPPPSPFAYDDGFGEVWGVAVDSKGNTGVAAQTVFTSSGANQAILAKLDPKGGEIWKKTIGGTIATNDSIAEDVTADSSDAMIFVGYVAGQTDFGNGKTAAGSFIVKYASDGTAVFAKGFPNSAAFNAVTTDANGDIYIGGELEGDVDFGGGNLHSVDWNTFFVHLDKDGNYVGQKLFSGGDIYCYGIAVDSKKNIILAGMFNGGADFGGGVMSGPPFRTGSDDAFLAKLDNAGGYIMQKHYVSAALGKVVTDAADNVYVVGGFSKTTDFGGGTMTSAGGGDIVVAKLDPMLGYGWAKQFGDKLDQGAFGIALDRGGNIVITGGVSGTVDFGLGAVDAGGAFTGSVFAARLDPSGKTLAAKIAQGTSGGHAIAAASRTEVVVGGWLQGNMTFGSATIANEASATKEGFVARISP